jgi:molecular chaperone GrpE
MIHCSPDVQSESLLLLSRRRRRLQIAGGTDHRGVFQMGSEPPAGECYASGDHAPGVGTSEPEAGPEEVRSELDEVRSRHLRLAADSANFRKRARQEQQESAQNAAGDLAGRILRVIDDLERALQEAPPGIDENWLRGIELTLQTLRDQLAAVGVEPIEAVGSQFDPHLHEAVGSEESAGHREGEVLQELRRGYRINRDVLRPSPGQGRQPSFTE